MYARDNPELLKDEVKEEEVEPPHGDMQPPWTVYSQQYAQWNETPTQRQAEGSSWAAASSAAAPPKDEHVSAPPARARSPGDEALGSGPSAYENHDPSFGSSPVSEQSNDLSQARWSGHVPTDRGSNVSTDDEQEDARLEEIITDAQLAAERQRRFNAMMFAWNAPPDMIWFASPELRRNRRYWQIREEAWRRRH